MRTIFKIAKTELRDLFYSPIAWLILIIFAFQTGMSFSAVISEMAKNQALGYQMSNLTLGTFGGWNGLFSTVQSYLYLYIPLLTMSLMSRELSSGSIKLLYSSPITNGQIILGKYVAMLIYGLALMGVLAVYVIYGAIIIDNADIPVMLSGLLGVYLLLCAYVAIGLFMSSLTSYQIVAAVGTLAILAALTYVRGMWQGVAILREITYWFGMTGRSGKFSGGLICSEDIIYFLVVIALFLFMTIIRMQSRRQKTTWMLSFGKYAAIWLIAILIAWFSSRPAFMSYHDATRLKVNTITPNSQEILKQATGGLKITSYVNILDEFSWIGMPEGYNDDIRRFEQYVRFKPEIKMEYVLYYDTVKNDYLEQAYEGLNYEEKAQKVIESNKLNPKKVLTPEQIRERVDLHSSEGNRFVRLLERESGEKTFLRVFNDQQIFPSEAEISAALKRIVLKELPTVGFLTGHGERETDRPGDRNYCMFTHMPTVRQSLVNQGFDYENISLDKDIPAEINILVIAEMREPMSPEEKVYFDRYIARGGNLMIIGEPGRQKVMNPVVEPFGVKFMDGFLIQPEKKKDPEEENQNNMNLGPFTGFVAPAKPLDLIVTQPTEGAVGMSYVFGQLRPHYVIAMPTAAGLEYSTDKGFNVIPMLVTDSTCWNELEIVDVVDEEVVCNPNAGEVEQPYTVALALSREMGGKEQKIVILSDADCISDGEFSRSRPGFWVANYSVVQGSFHWLSDGEVPIDIRRPFSVDRTVSVGEKGAEIFKYAVMAVIPGILLFLALFIWLRRRSR